MCLTVEAVVTMLVVGRGSATAMVEEAATLAVEEADDERGGRVIRVYLFLPTTGVLTIDATLSS